MSSRQFEAAVLELDKLDGVTDLSIHTIRKAELGKLKGLEDLALNSLTLRWLSSPDLTAVPLPNGLISLSVWHSPKLKSLRGLEQAADLKELYLRENGTPIDITAIGSLRSLEHLIIDGGYGTGQEIVDLSPLEGLPIEELSFVNVKCVGLDLGPIARLPNLKAMNLPGLLIPPDELAKLAAAFPWYYRQLIDLKQADVSYAKPCKKCGQLPHELFLRSKKWHWCLNCQGDKVQSYLNDFAILVGKA